MSKQEEIKEVIDTYVDDGCLYPDKTCAWYSKEGYCASGNDAYTCLMKRLAELGVVIKADRELPQIPTNAFEDYKRYEVEEKCQLTQRDMLGAGYGAFETLIGEDNAK